MTEETKKEEEQQEKPEEMLAKALASFQGAPTQEQILTWKQTYGDIFCSGFSETELFVFRPVNRKEFVTQQVEAAKSQLNALELEERLVATCMLWASPAGALAFQRKAGSLSTLHEQIIQQSNFMDPRVAAALCIKL